MSSPVMVVEPSEGTIDPLGPASGAVLALILCVPFWVAIFWALTSI